MIDGEIIVANLDGNTLDFEALQQRITADSRVKMLSGATRVAFDLLAIGDENLMNTPLIERRAALQRAWPTHNRPIHVAGRNAPRRSAGSSRAPASTD